MNVVVVCEFSGIVRDAFIKAGHNAVSVDIIPSESDGPHIVSDARSVDYSDFDLAICHPPCTYLAVSGARWFKDRMEEQEKALDFVQFLMNLPVPKIAIENPISVISTKIRKPDQIVQPWMFGHTESKRTCLWLKGLPKLMPTDLLTMPSSGHWDNQTPSGQNKLGPSPDRWKDRSRTYTGLAEAMATQWGG